MKRSSFQALALVAKFVFASAVIFVWTAHGAENVILSGAIVLGTNNTSEPLVLKLPAPTIKSGPVEPSSGPNIEPYSEKPPPPFLVPKGVKNVAAGRPAITSIKPFTGEPSQVTDGRKEALDSDMVEMKKGAQWVQVDLGEDYAIYGIAIWHDHRYWTQIMHDVIVQISDDPTFQKGVTTLFNNDRDNSSGVGIGTDLEYFESKFGRIVDGKGIKARYIRGYTNGSNLWRGNSWQELEVYGFPADSKGSDAYPPSTIPVEKSVEPLKLQVPAPAPK